MFDGERETKTGDELVKYVFGFLPSSATDGHRATQFFCGGFFGWYYDELLSDCHFSRTDPLVTTSLNLGNKIKCSSRGADEGAEKDSLRMGVSRFLGDIVQNHAKLKMPMASRDGPCKCSQHGWLLRISA